MNYSEARRWLLLILLLVASGCGGAGDLHGTVTFKGKPLRMGTVSVAGGDGIICSGVIQDDGAYTVRGIATGTVRIAVSSIDPNVQKGAAKSKGGLVAAPTGDASKWIAVPEQYGDFDRSGLTFPLSSGHNTLEIELK